MPINIYSCTINIDSNQNQNYAHTSISPLDLKDRIFPLKYLQTLMGIRGYAGESRFNVLKTDFSFQCSRYFFFQERCQCRVVS